MAYQVIARKYRPQRFKDVVGQEHVTETLAHAIEQKRIAHAYIFCGPRGTGKTTIARIFAKCLNCTGGPKVDFSDDDPKAKEIAEGRSMDVLEIDGASNNGVEQVRELRETCQYLPAGGKYKIYIIDEVHMLSTGAFNALLKTLEEPPEHVKFLFATTDPEKVLPTILSRCQRYDLRRIPSALISKHLAHIAKQEKVKVDEAALYAIARGSDGALRDAESTLDQLISFCGDHIQENDVLSMFGLTAQTQILELASAILAGEVQKGLQLLNELANRGKDLGRLITDLLNHFRNLLIHRVSNGDVSMLEASEAETAALAEQSAKTSVEALTRILEVLADAELRLRDAPSRKIALEVALLRAIQAREAVSVDKLLNHLQTLKTSGGGTTPAVSASGSPARASASSRQPAVGAATAEMTTAMPPEPVRAESIPQTPIQNPAATTSESADLETLWTRLLEAVGRASPFARAYLNEAHPVSFQKGLFVIGFDPQFAEHIPLVDNARNQGLLQTKLAELGFPNSQFKFIKSDAPAGRIVQTTQTPPAASAPAASAPAAAVSRPVASAAPGPARSAAPAPAAGASREKSAPAPIPFDKETFKNDPVIARALEIFKGQIVEVRA